MASARLDATFIAGLWIVFFAYWFVSSFGAKRNVRGRARLALLPRLTGAVFVLFVLGFHRGADVARTGPASGSSPAVGAVGVALCALGMAFAVWARLHLGKNWGMPMSEKEQPELVTAGPYCFVRHPIYAGILLAIAGSALVAGPWYDVAVVVPFALYFLYSAKMEEKFLLRQFPGAYRDYMLRTKMLVPFVF